MVCGQSEEPICHVECFVDQALRNAVAGDQKEAGIATRFGKIGDGDVNWRAVREALAEISFTGWCTAEVRGGDRERLTDIALRMDEALAL